MIRDFWICVGALVVLLTFGAHGVRDYLHRRELTKLADALHRDIAKAPATYPNGVPLPPLNTPIPQDFLIGPTYNGPAGSRTDFLFTQNTDTGIMYRPMDFQINGTSVAHVHKRGRDLVYVVGGKEVGRMEFYRFMDAWLRKNAGIWAPPK